MSDQLTIDHDANPRDRTRPHGMVVTSFADVATWAGAHPPLVARIEWCVQDKGCLEQGDHWSGEGGVSWDDDCPNWVDGAVPPDGDAS